MTTDLVIAVAVALFVYTGWSCFRHDWQRTQPLKPPVPGRERPPSEKATPNPPRGPSPAPGHNHGGLRCQIILYAHDGSIESRTKGFWCGCAHSYDADARLTAAEPCKKPDWDRWLKDLTS